MVLQRLCDIADIQLLAQSRYLTNKTYHNNMVDLSETYDINACLKARESRTSFFSKLE